jgi:hypothetical protein
MRGIAFTTTERVSLETETCYRCGVLFAMTAEYRQKRLADHSLNFYCPNGHGQAYIGKTEAERERERREAAERREKYWRSSAEDTERRLRATKGVVTKMRKRVTAGTCPFGCRRHFANLERHVASKHPGAKLEGEA